MKYFIFILFICLLFTCTLKQDEENTPNILPNNAENGMSDPPSLYFKILTKNDLYLMSDTLRDSTYPALSSSFYPDSLRLYYYINNSINYVDYFGLRDITFEDPLKHYQYIEAPIGWLSSFGYKTFYLRLNYLDTDTIFYDIIKKKGLFYKNKITWNGRDISKDRDPYEPWIYLIVK
jgi:hypothetical protein